MNLPEVEALLEDYLGRKLNSEEKDLLWIRRHTGAWGFQGEHSINRISELQGITHRTVDLKEYHDDIEPEGDLRYIAKTGNPIYWVPVRESMANQYIGIVAIPQRNDKDGKNYCAQFVGSKIYKVWMTIEQVEKVVKKMLQNKSLLTAVEQSLEIPLTQLEKELICSIMRN